MRNIGSERPPTMPVDRQTHWDRVYSQKAPVELSWYQPRPDKSLELIGATGIGPNEAIIDVGAGASLLADALLGAGYRDLTVLDVSEQALLTLAARLPQRAVALLHQDVTRFRPERRYALWHDRAVFHFLMQRAERERYVRALRESLATGGHVIIATFGGAGPERCSGLPVMRYDAAALASELGTGFELLEAAEELHRTPWGSTQQFQYCRFRRDSGA